MITCLILAKVWLINKVNVNFVKEAAVLVGLFAANGNQSHSCLLQTGWDNF